MKKIGIHPLFFALGLIFVLLGWAKAFFNYLLAVCLHELAHAFVAKKLSYTLSKFFLMPYGAGLSLNQKFLSPKDEILIASAGPACSFLLALIFIALWWICPETYALTETFVWANMTTGIINLLPAYPLDGGRILTAFLTLKNQNRRKSLRVCFVFNYVLCAVLLVVFAVDFHNFTALIFAIFVFLGTFELKLTGNYELSNFPFFETKFLSGEHIKINQFAILGTEKVFKLARHLKQNHLNLVYVVLQNGQIKILPQKKIEEIWGKFSIHTTLEEVLSK